ncbi:hypothetical protein FRC04_002482 [Tulasnella sp. 424]|nr:hypothetical protein FRC04_002482 [Tulasnella sp. 424]KAG8967587.1 hypothetical protein FRC05_002020 [Tulasnella sp. 425]
MDQINKLIEEIHVLVTKIADAGVTQTPFMRACIKVDLWQKIEGAVRTKGSRARQARNTLSPIQQLPTEVTLQLFDTVLMLVGRRHYHDILKGMSEVCHHWRKIIHHTPALWSKIYCSAVREVVDQALERSATHPLDVWFSSVGRGNKIALESFLEKLSPHMGRCQRVALTYFGEWDQSEGLAELASLPAPKLEQVVLEDQRWLSDLSGVELFGGQAGMLKDVQILGIACNWECAAFKGLRVIGLSKVSFPSVDSLLGILDQSRCLSCLQLSFITFTDNDAATMVRCVTFPLLDNLSLVFEDVLHTEIILDHIKAPICSHLCFFIPDGVEIGGKVMHLAAKWLAQRQAPVPKLQSATFALLNSEVSLSGVSTEGLEALSLTLKCGHGEENTARLLNAANCVAKELLCAIESRFKIDEGAIDFLQHPKVVEELSQLLPVTTIEIGDPFSDGEGRRYWGYPRQFTLPPFPSMRVFRTFHQPLECIFSILKGIFTIPIPNTEDRAVHVEIHGPTHPKPDWLDYIATQTKEIVGDNCRSSFVLTPRLSNVGD